MSNEIKRYNEPLYYVGFRPYCSLICTQRMAKILVKELNKYRNAVIDLVDKYPDEFYSEEWSLAYPNNEQTPFYVINKNELPVNKIQRAKKGIRMDLDQVENIYSVDNFSVFDDEVKQFVEEDLQQ